MSVLIHTLYLQAAQAQNLDNIPSLDFAPPGFSVSQKVRAFLSAADTDFRCHSAASATDEWTISA